MFIDPKGQTYIITVKYFNKFYVLYIEVEVSSDLDTETQQDEVNVNNSVYLTPQSLRSHGTSNA